MSKKFTRTIEDFICEKCGQEVKGNGYTNHCPFCLWSKHVDINPGDREESCGGLMEPIDVIYEKRDWIIIHKCQKCGKTMRKKMGDEDNFDEAVKIRKKVSERK